MFGLGQTLQGARPLPGPTCGPDAGLPGRVGTPASAQLFTVTFTPPPGAVSFIS